MKLFITTSQNISAIVILLLFFSFTDATEAMMGDTQNSETLHGISSCLPQQQTQPEDVQVNPVEDVSDDQQDDDEEPDCD